ncbi:MAG TPA: TolC family protein, partial [Verrucomicrobiae bacterium]|nr:TolC family protein [Verrucomicrobiae bacterium]
LQHNLDLQVDRYNPQIALRQLGAAYGNYDPSFSFSGQHDYSESGSRLLSGSFNIGGSKSEDDRFSPALSGLLPWGMTYSFQASASDTYGSSGGAANDPSQPILTTNSYVNINSGQTISYVTTNYAQVPVRLPFENSSGSATVTLTQPLLKNFLIDQPRLNIRVAKNRLKYSELGLKQQVMQTVTTLEQAYYDLIYARENVVVQEKAVELAEELVAQNRKRVQVGTLAILDEKQAESQAATSQAALIAAKSALAVQQNLVKQLITDNYSDWADVLLEPSGTLHAPIQSFNLQNSWRKGLTDRPDLLQAKLDLERAGIQLKYDRNQLLPELDVFGTYGFNGSGKEFSGALYDIQQRTLPTYTFGGQITLPLANTAARNNFKASKMTLQQAVLSVKRLERDVMVQIDNDIKQAQSSYQQVDATRAARAYAEDALAAEQKKLENGKSTTYTVLQMQRDLTTARGNEIQALANYNINLSQLSLDEGTTLQRLDINFEWR